MLDFSYVLAIMFLKGNYYIIKSGQWRVMILLRVVSAELFLCLCLEYIREDREEFIIRELVSGYWERSKTLILGRNQTGPCHSVCVISVLYQQNIRSCLNFNL